MGDLDAIDFAQVDPIFQRLAVVAKAMAHPAGVGELETVGHLVSYLLDHPRDIEPCLRFGVFELPDDWIEKGSLTFHGADGKVRHPSAVRHARVIKRMEASA